MSVKKIFALGIVAGVIVTGIAATLLPKAKATPAAKPEQPKTAEEVMSKFNEDLDKAKADLDRSMEEGKVVDAALDEAMDKMRKVRDQDKGQE